MHLTAACALHVYTRRVACTHVVYTCVTYICLACVHGFMCHIHVRCTCPCCYYVTCMSNTHVHVATMPHECQVDVCMCYSATCMSSTHVHVATMPHECQVHICLLLLCHMHVKYTCACHYYAT